MITQTDGQLSRCLPRQRAGTGARVSAEAYTNPLSNHGVFTPGADAVDLRNSRAEVESPQAGFV